MRVTDREGSFGVMNDGVSAKYFFGKKEGVVNSFMYQDIIDINASFSVPDMEDFQQCAGDASENEGGAGFVK